MFRCIRLPLMMFTWLVIVPSAAYAQASITGVVRDTSGAVLPGVTVEAASPALIERVRLSVTDGTGQYRIENLRPGPYVMTFTLPGFATVRREGIELTGTFTATVNAELRVGALEETVTVTGEAPVVDVQSTTRQTVLDQEILDAIPASRSPYLLSSTLPGVTRGTEDVGGIIGDGAARGSQTARGNSDTRVVASGLGLHSATGQTSGIVTAMNLGVYQEVAVDTGGISAENAEGGVIINLIPRDGGNTFSGRLFTNFANNAMQASNFTQDLEDRGLGTPNSVGKLWEFNPGFGGPIKRDRLWFHWSARHAGAFENVPMFFNKNAGDPTKWTYEPDTSRPAANKNTVKDFSSVRLTWQATAKNKFAVTYDHTDVCDCPRAVTATIAPEAAAQTYQHANRTAFGVEWTAPLTSRVLLEAAFGSVSIYWPRPRENPFLPPGTVGMISVQEQSTGLTYRASTANFETRDNRLSSRVALSYVTGAHAFKTGFSYGAGKLDRLEYSIDAPLLFRFNNGVPNQITQHARDRLLRTHLDADHGLFVQDRWTVGRLTLTGGLRYDLMAISYPEMRVGPTEFAPTRSIVLPATQGLRWHDLSPRSGLAYDVFGDGKTALKVSVNKYVAAMAMGSGGRGIVQLTTEVAPAARLVTRTTRSWNDANRDFVPDCDLLSPAANGECGLMSDRNFGSTRSGLTFDPDVLTGWTKRPNNWQFEVGVQREILPRVSMNVSYWRSWWGNFFVTDDRAVGPADFDSFSITAPVDPRLPGGGGYVIAGLYDLKPEKFGVPADNFLTSADKYGKQTEVWNGVDVTVNARPRPGVFLSGGMTTQRQTTDNCEVVANLDNPSPLFCDVKGRFLTSVKFLASYTVPRIDIQVSGNVQNLGGPQITAAYVASNAVVAPSLGRNLAGGARNVTVDLVEPRSMYRERMTRLDLRVGKILQFGRTRVTPSVDLYNVLNASTVLGQSSAYATWQRPQAIMPARFAKVGLQLEF